MQNWIFASIAGVVLFFVLQSIDDRRNDQRHLPRASTAKRAMMFMFIMLIVHVLAYFISWSSGDKTLDLENTPLPKIADATSVPPVDPSVANAIHAQMLRSIKEDVIVGRPPF